VFFGFVRLAVFFGFVRLAVFFGFVRLAVFFGFVRLAVLSSGSLRNAGLLDVSIANFSPNVITKLTIISKTEPGIFHLFSTNFAFSRKGLTNGNNIHGKNPSRIHKLEITCFGKDFHHGSLFTLENAACAIFGGPNGIIGDNFIRQLFPRDSIKVTFVNKLSNFVYNNGKRNPSKNALNFFSVFKTKYPIDHRIIDQRVVMADVQKIQRQTIYKTLRLCSLYIYILLLYLFYLFYRWHLEPYNNVYRPSLHHHHYQDRLYNILRYKDCIYLY
jgi:hypothetical protein